MENPDLCNKPHETFPNFTCTKLKGHLGWCSCAIQGWRPGATVLTQIAQTLTGMERSDLTKTERQIVDILVEQGILIQEEPESVYLLSRHFS